MSRKASEGPQIGERGAFLPGRTSQDAERLAVAYLEALRRVSERDHWAEAHKTPLRAAEKVTGSCFLLENGVAVLWYAVGGQADSWRGEVTDFETLKGALEPRAYDHLVVLYPSMLEEDAALEAVASEASARAVAAPGWAATFEEAVKALREARLKLAELFKANPWLEKTLSDSSAELGTLEEKLAALGSERAQAETRRAFEGFEDAVERAERYRVDEAQERLQRINEHTVELFAKELLKTYRKQVETAGLMPGEEPALFRAFPYRVEALLLTNKSVLLCVKKATQGAGFAVLPSDFTRAKGLLHDPGGAFVVALDNDARLEAAEARFLGEQLAAVAVEDSKHISRVRAGCTALAKAEKEVASAGKINPWLEGQASKLSDSLVRVRKMLERAVQDFDGALEKGAVLRSELIRSDLSLAPHGQRPVLAPAPGPSPRGPRAPAAAAPATRAQAPSVVNVPNNPEQVFQEVDYYNLPPSSAVGQAGSAGAPASSEARIVDLAPAPAAPRGAVDTEMRAKVYDLEMRLNDYERRLYYMDKYTEMLQKQQLDKLKLMRDLIKVEGKRNRARAYGISVVAVALALLALIAVLPESIAAITAFLHGLGL